MATRRTHWALAPMLALLALAPPGQRAEARIPEPTADVVVRDVTIVDVEHGTLRLRQDIVVRGTRVAAIAATGEARPAAKTTIDGRGKFVMPGFIDGPVRLAAFSPQALQRLLAAGVTTVIDVGTASTTLDRWRRDLADGRLYAPRIPSGCPVTPLAGALAGSPSHPDAIHDALIESQSAGRSPLQALRAVTVDRARAGCAALGSVAIGRPADFVVLTANPLDELRHSRAIDAVVFRGEVLTRAHLTLLAQGALPTPTPPH